jgi:hypothetical protein
MTDRGRGLLQKSDPENSEIMQCLREHAFDASQFHDPSRPFNSERIRTSQDGWAAKFTLDAFHTSMTKLVDQIQIDI